MLSVAIDNASIAKLIESIVLDHSLLNGLSAENLEDIINFSVANNDYRALDIITNIHTGIYGYDDRQPEWLESSFPANKWVLTFGKTPKTIHWDTVYLDDGKKLTDTKHHKLLNSFKYWITAADNPLENGGKTISPTTASVKVNKVIALINAVLLHSKELKLAKYHLLNVNDDFWLNIANESLFDLFSVLQGAIQVLVGAIMARRQDELIKLKPHGNLSPNVSPFSKEGAKTEYNLIFKVKKTGSKGVNATIERPIPLSIAKFIWQLEQFNIKASELNLCKGELYLFNNLDSQRSQLSQTNSCSYNAHLNALCDYLETDLVQYDNGEYRRNYVRQHQLRRFFAMAFFWSKGFDGMDALRWMLGHSDMEHLYNYISESETGAVLNGAKASVIVRGIVDSTSELAKLDGIEEVRKIIAERLTGDSSTPITVETVSEAVEDYDDEFYLTVPHISQIQKEQDIEIKVIDLLEEGRITLEPEFFTIDDIDGNTTQSFNLILKIKDLD